MISCRFLGREPDEIINYASKPTTEGRMLRKTYSAVHS